MDDASADLDREATTDIDELVEADSLVEEVSIDGMCGVY
jgi:mycofactocin precursor